MNENQAELSQIDLFATRCPPGMTVEIEGFKPMGTYHLPRPDLATAIAHVFCLCSHQAVRDPEQFFKRVTITGLNEAAKYIRIRVTGE